MSASARAWQHDLLKRRDGDTDCLPELEISEPRSIASYLLLTSRTERLGASKTLASIFRIFYEHPDWSQLFDFFMKRYGKGQAFSDRDARRLCTAKYKAGTSKVVHFRTDLESVGLPTDILERLESAKKMSTTRAIGYDAMPTAIGPAIAMGLGIGAYMDLMYQGKPPGAYPAIAAQSVSKYEMKSGSGRGRTLADWAWLWSAFGRWAYEHDSTLLQNHCLSVYGAKYPIDAAARHAFVSEKKHPRVYLKTDAIHAIDSVYYGFEQMALSTSEFQGIEWKYLDTATPANVREAFYSIFGSRSLIHANNLRVINEDILPLGQYSGLAYSQVRPMDLNACPSTFNGQDWENWYLSVQGGQVVVVKTVFQALWAVMLLTQLPVNITIMGLDDEFPSVRDPDAVYL